MGNFGDQNAAPARIILDEPGRGLSLSLSSRWKRQIAEIFVLDGGIRDLIDLLEGDDAEFAVFSSMSAVSIFDFQAVLDVASGHRGELVKVSVQKTPIETYVGRRALVLKLLSAYASRFPKPARSGGYLFGGALAGGIDLIEEIPGRLLFQNDLMDLYRNNLWLAANGASEDFNAAIANLPELSETPSESRILDRGFLKDSFMAGGCEIEGSVEGSVIFPNVSIRANASVCDSVVMTNNRIGAGSSLQNALVLPFFSEGARNSPNIGDNCQLGGRSPASCNADFPEQIRDGMALVGMNAFVPGSFRAEAGTCIGPETSASRLRRQKILRKGASIFEEDK
jgi:hypothetical protein